MASILDVSKYYVYYGQQIESILNLSQKNSKSKIEEIAPTGFLRFNNGYLEQQIEVLVYGGEGCFKQSYSFIFWLRPPSVTNGSPIEMHN